MIIRNLVVGPLNENCFIIGDETAKKAIIIDPGDEFGRIMEVVKENSLSVEYIVCTHAHFDHIGAAGSIRRETGAKIILHRDDMEIYLSAGDQAALWGYDIDPLPEPDTFAGEGDAINLGALKFVVMHSPGHSPGGICLYGEGIVITGDTLFAGSVGRTDFYGGDMAALKKSIKRLMSLPPETEVLAGHGPNSTIGREKTENPFIASI